MERKLPQPRSILLSATFWRVLLCLLFFRCFPALAQPVITSTPETCAGDGSISCSLSDPSATNIQFRVYELPDTVNAIAVLTPGNNTVSVPSGNYQVNTTATVGGSTITYPPQTVQIQNVIVPLAFELDHTDSHCNDGTITVQVTSGFGSLYEILEGPQTFPPQASPTFTGLSGGLYKVRVTDACGAQLAEDHTVPVNTVDLTIAQASFPDVVLPSCNTITAQNIIGPQNPLDEIFYPLALTFTIFPPGGAPTQTITGTITAGGPSTTTASAIIPFWHGQVYSYTLTVTDACGNSWTRPSNVVNEKLFVDVVPELEDCGTYIIKVGPMKFVPPYQIEFLSAPEGFDPEAFNADHPGPFTGAQQFYGSSDNPIPFGTYEIRITDSCNHQSEIRSIEVSELDLPPMGTLLPHPGCQSNMSDVTIEWPGYLLESIVIIEAPDTYPATSPLDFSDTINLEQTEGSAYNLTEGHYTLLITDVCGRSEELEIEVLGLTANIDISKSTRADCELGKGGVRARATNLAVIVSGVMTGAPASSGFATPVIIDDYIMSDGTFSMTGLEPGTYTFSFTDSCGSLHENVTANIPAYAITQNQVAITKYCQAFDVQLSHTTVATVSQKFWLQRFDPVGNTWGHPATGVVYPEGTMPNTGNSRELTNNSNNINLSYSGQFRILKIFESFENGNVEPEIGFKNCIEILEEFTSDGTVDILNIQKLTCDGALSDIKILADGAAPLIFRIVEKNGLAFLVENGSNDTFTGLEAAVYKFTVENVCGDTDVRTVDISSLPSLVHAGEPEAVLYSCGNGPGDDSAAFDLSQQDDDILDGQSPDDFTVTYHLSQDEANSGSNALPANYTSESATIYARVRYNGSSNCYETTSFELVVNPVPFTEIDPVYPICPGTGATIDAGPGFDAYLWSTGETTPSIVVETAGNYTLTLASHYASGDCTGVYAFEVLPAVPPSDFTVSISDWTDDRNSITVNVSQAGNFLYSIDGVNFQESNVFNNLNTGVYTVFVKDEMSCETISKEVFLLSYPKFFTPNADGFNDFWKVRFSEYEPNLKTYIFDRYGKLITGFGSNSIGWDGNYNGRMLPSTDYWFLVIREDGREMRGHFAMKR